MGLTITTKKVKYADLLFGLFYLLSWPQRCLTKMTIDLESYDCVQFESFFVSDTELVSIMARPRSDVVSRADCKIQLRAQPNRKFNIYLHDIYIRDCGVKLEFFENVHRINPTKTFGCQTSPGVLFSTRSNFLIIKLSKASSAATRYRIQIELATNKGPKLGTNVYNRSKNRSLTITALCTILLITWLVIWEEILIHKNWFGSQNRNKIYIWK